MDQSSGECNQQGPQQLARSQEINAKLRSRYGERGTEWRDGFATPPGSHSPDLLAEDDRLAVLDEGTARLWLQATAKE